MSVVNKMLNDLEARRTQADEVSADYHPPQKKPANPMQSKLLVIVLIIAATAAIIFAITGSNQGVNGNNNADPVKSKPVPEAAAKHIRVVSEKVITQKNIHPPITSAQPPKAKTELIDTATNVTLKNIHLPNIASQDKQLETQAGKAQTEKSQAEKAQTEKAQTEKVQTEKAQTEKAQTEKVQTEKAQTEKVQAEKAQTEKAQTEKAQTEKAQTEKAQAEKAQAEKAQAEKAQAEKAQAEKAQASSFSMTGSRQKTDTRDLKQRIAQSLSNNNVDFAQSLLLELLEAEPDNIKARKKLASLLFAQGNYAQSKQLLIKGIKLHPAKSNLRLMLARLYVLQKDPPKALNILAEVQPNPNNQVEYLTYRAALAQQLKQTKLAKSDYQTLTRVETDNAKWWLGLAIAEDQLGEMNMALKSYKMASSLDQLDVMVNEFIQNRISILTAAQ